ncbi:MAG: radical SAM family heme chaperone HemW [Actinobacteria bacterium]|nr:radical SAM family heme chaperone HemW [Actinomycetota bacterium]
MPARHHARRSPGPSRRARLAPDPVTPSAPFGVYVHIPFCRRRCDYCAFATWDDRPHLLADYVVGLRREIDAAVVAGLAPAASVFFGGGTPSLLSAAQVATVLAPLPLAPGAEVTLECNPETVGPRELAAYRQAGVTRISLGAQSLVDRVLVALGRTHDARTVIDAAAAVATAGFESWNLDLIYGTVGETLDDWRQTLEVAVGLAPAHVSAYGLTVEAGTPLALDPARFPDDDDQADKYLAAEDALAAAGLANYEISNWARPGHVCRHNRCYWSQGDYRGFGCAAHSHQGGRRWWNVRTPERYLALLAAGAPVEAGGEHLDDAGRRLEALQLSLRTTEGVPVDALDTDGLDGLVARHHDRRVLTVAGRLLANEVALRLR